MISCVDERERSTCNGALYVYKRCGNVRCDRGSYERRNQSLDSADSSRPNVIARDGSVK